MSQGRAPQPQQPMPSPMKASPMAAVGSVEDRVAAYRGNPAPLQQRYAMSQDLLDLLALQKIKSEKESAARQMQMQMAQQKAAEGAEMTIAQQREKEVMDLTKNELAEQRGDTAQQQVSEQQANLQKLMSGIARAPGAQAAAQPKMMAAGGIVAFDKGGEVDSARERIRAARQRLQSFGTMQRRNDPEGFSAAQQELEAAQAALQAAEGAYAAEMSAAGVDRPAFSRRDVGGVRQAMQGEPAAPAAPAGPPVSAAYPDETTRGSAAGLAALPRATPPERPSVAPSVPAAPAAATPAAAPAGLPAALPGKPAAPGVSMIPGLQASIEADVARDPEAAQRAQEDRIRKMYELTPEQRAVYEQGIAQRQRMFEEAYDPERQRREGLKQFLIGAGGRRYGEFAGGARAGMAYDEEQRAQRLKDFEAMQKSREGLVGLEREGIKPAIEGGLKGLEQASAMRRQGQASGANIYGTDMQARTAELNRQVEMAKVAAQNAANAVQRESLDFSRMQGHLNTIVTNRARAVEAVQKRFAPQLSMLEMQLQAAPNDKKLLQQRDSLSMQIEAAVDEVTKDFDEAKALVESRLYGKSGAGTGGYTVRKKESTK